MASKKPIMFRIIKYLIKVFYPKTEIIGLDKLNDEPVIIVGNHTQMNGPIVGEIYFPENVYIWCANQMMDIKKVPEYAFTDFWSQKPKYTHSFYKLLSFIIAPVSALIFNNARTIAVYKDKRVITTFRQTVERLQSNNSVLIFPEYDKKYNSILYDFQDRFIDVARLYYKKTGKELSFVPLYIAPKLKKAFLGNPIRYNHEIPMEEQRVAIKTYLMNEITNIAVALPRHTVVPYRNIKKSLYPTNILQENDENAKPSC